MLEHRNQRTAEHWQTIDGQGKNEAGKGPKRTHSESDDGSNKCESVFMPTSPLDNTPKKLKMNQDMGEAGEVSEEEEEEEEEASIFGQEEGILKPREALVGDSIRETQGGAVMESKDGGPGQDAFAVYESVDGEMGEIEDSKQQPKGIWANEDNESSEVHDDISEEEDDVSGSEYEESEEEAVSESDESDREEKKLQKRESPRRFLVKKSTNAPRGRSRR
ncbi:hypothetical protein E2P81_ATG06737 [Venturia nashicola]|uniref:Uncharacterized protein n=1 Tax=Venturia nashicola TaxID=86259 RepID=A0A4Z1NU07_9PEZI|nr:hypothetical protein E6O75_ATG06908 [Venturia nashicola]TLD30084.1 hypothetical protein E2P81_ATG06737 [Venturia nashicola]